MSDQIERMARIETWKDGHEDQCKERYQDIKDNTKAIKETLSTMASDLKSAVERIHGRIDNEAQTAREATGAVDSRLGAHKVWILTTAVSGAGAVIAFLIDKLWKSG